jgi:formate hydrogenlyase subunit 4
MIAAADWLIFLLYLVLLPFLTLGLIRKTKARLQNRIGAPVFQPLFDFLKLSRKGETLSQTMTWLFRSTAAINVSLMLLLAILAPWTVIKPSFAGVDLFFVIYAFAAARFFTILSALDSGSAFGAFGASREATLSLLVEPATILGLASLAVANKTSDLTSIFAYDTNPETSISAIWILAGIALMLASVVELSRMPIDDPTTHLELTMVHEAMILEASGRNLALIEYAHSLRMTILFGLVVQCLMHAIPKIYSLSAAARSFISVLGILVAAVLLGVFEILSVKLRWRKNPDFIAYALTMSLLACFIALGRGLVL